MPRYIIADRDPLMRRLLARMVHTCDPAAAVDEATTGLAAIEQYAARGADGLIVMLRRHDLGQGLTIAKLRADGAALPIIVVVDDGQQSAMARWLGASSVLLLPFSLDELRQALQPPLDAGPPA